MKRREQLSKAKMSFDRKEKFQASYEQEKEKITSILKHVRQGGGGHAAHPLQKADFINNNVTVRYENGEWGRWLTTLFLHGSPCRAPPTPPASWSCDASGVPVLLYGIRLTSVRIKFPSSPANCRLFVSFIKPDEP